jgi:aldose 1-epimerase
MTRLERIDSPGGELSASFAPDANCVCCSLTHDGDEVLGQRNGLEGYLEKGSTMGIPLLHPWANRLDARIDSPLVKHDANGLPIHGVLPRALRWEAERVSGSELRARLEWTRDDLLAVFPHRHVLTLDARLGDDALTLTTTLEPLDAEVPVSFGYHPYFVLPGVPRADWEVVLPGRRHTLLDERGLPAGDGEREPGESAPLGARVFDDGYDELDRPPVFGLDGGSRRIEVELREGYPIAQVYAPAGEDLIAFEPMTAPVNALVSGDRLRHAAPERPYRASFTVRCMRD